MSSETIAERIVFLQNALNLSEPAFARALGMAQSSLWRITKGGGKPRIDTVDKIVSTTNCNRDWILTGTGEPFAPTAPAQSDLYDALKAKGHKVIPLFEATAQGMEQTPGDMYVMPRGVALPPDAKAICIMDDSFPPHQQLDHLIIHEVYAALTNSRQHYIVNTARGCHFATVGIGRIGYVIAPLDKSIEPYSVEIEDLEFVYTVLYTISREK